MLPRPTRACAMKLLKVKWQHTVSSCDYKIIGNNEKKYFIKII